MNKEILRLAVPNIISNISVPLLSMVDLAIVGHLGTESYIGALAVAATIFNILYWAFGFLRMGTTGFTAQAYGSKNLQECADIFLRAISIGGIVAILLILLQKPISIIAFWLIDTSPETQNLALKYFFIRIWAAPCNLLLFALNGWYFGMQNSKIPMFVTILINTLNIPLSLLFVFHLQMDIVGVAYGTLCAQYCGLACAILFWIFKYKHLIPLLSFQRVLVPHKLIQFFKVNMDIFLRSICFIIVFSCFTIFSAKFGDKELAINSLLLQLFYLFSYLLDGFAYAAESLTGKYIGAQNPKLLKKSIRYIFRWSWGICFIFTIIYLFFQDKILLLLTDKQSLIIEATPYRYWIALIPLFGVGAFIWDGIYGGATAAKEMRNAITIATIVYFLFFFSTKAWLHNHALWISMLLFLLLRGVFMKIFAPKAIYQKIDKATTL